jgi:hypothetical protein
MIATNGEFRYCPFKTTESMSLCYIHDGKTAIVES